MLNKINKLCSMIEEFKEDNNNWEPSTKVEQDWKKNLEIDYVLLLEYIDNINFKQAGKTEKPLLQYGMFYDGINTLYYDKNIIDTLDSFIFNQAILNHLIHSYVKSNVKLTINPKGLKRFNSCVGLYLSHFKFVTIPPKYAQSKRNKLYNLYYKDSNVLIFEPHKDTANYFYNMVVSRGLEGEIETADGLPMKINLFKSYIGNIVEIDYKSGFITQSAGFRGWRNEKVEAPVIDKNGQWVRTTFQSNVAKETGEMKSMVDTLMRG